MSLRRSPRRRIVGAVAIAVVALLFAAVEGHGGRAPAGIAPVPDRIGSIAPDRAVLVAGGASVTSDVTDALRRPSPLGTVEIDAIAVAVLVLLGWVTRSLRPTGVLAVVRGPLPGRRSPPAS
jgi:hypothetical protein